MSDGPRPCPSCHGLNARQVRRCAHCTRDLAPRVRREPEVPVACPACAVPTTLVRLGGIAIDLCARCGGIRFDDGELEQLPAELSDAALATEAARVLRGLERPTGPARTVGYPPCPVCRQTMARRNFHEASGIVHARCSGHGSWLDATSAVRLLAVLADDRLGEIDQRARAAREEDTRKRLAALEADADRSRRQAEQQENQGRDRLDWLFDLLG